jgi:hypothetical protein
MVDFAEFATALEPALALSSGQFMTYYLSTKQEAHETAIESSPLAQAIVAFLDDNPDGFGGTPSDLLAKLNQKVGESKTKERGWPKDATRLSKALARLEPDLRACGIEYAYTRSKRNRFVSLQNKKVASPASPASPPLLGKDSKGDARKNVASPSVTPSVTPPEGSGEKGDATKSAGDARKNAASPLKPFQGKGSDAGDAGDAKKNLFRGETGEEIDPNDLGEEF